MRAKTTSKSAPSKAQARWRKCAEQPCSVEDDAQGYRKDVLGALLMKTGAKLGCWHAVRKTLPPNHTADPAAFRATGNQRWSGSKRAARSNRPQSKTTRHAICFYPTKHGLHTFCLLCSVMAKARCIQHRFPVVVFAFRARTFQERTAFENLNAKLASLNEMYHMYGGQNLPIVMHNGGALPLRAYHHIDAKVRPVTLSHNSKQARCARWLS